MKRVFAALLCGVCTPASHAAIVYTLPPQPISATAVGVIDYASASIDLNADGVPDLMIHAHNQFLASSAGVSPARHGARLRADLDNGLDYLEHLAAGTVIGPPDDYVYTGTLLMDVSNPPPYTPWMNTEGPAFFGFRCDIDGHDVVGWVRALYTFTSTPLTRSVTVFDYAYESTPGLPIAAGAIPAPGTATLSALASLAAFRRRRP